MLSSHSDHWEKLSIAGHTFHDRFLGAETLDPEIEAFLAAGAPPLVFTLGSFVARQRDTYYRHVAEAAQRLGRRALLLANEDDVAALRATIPGDVHIAAYAPHSQVFPRACAILHHGGAGTTGQALRAGLPQLIMPFLGDQFDNAARLTRLGVARKLDHATVTADVLTRELATLLGDVSLAQKAREVAGHIAAENGAVVAARQIAALINQPQIAERQTS